MITPANVLSHELVGLPAEIISSSNGDLVGLNGTVADETKSMIALDTRRGRRTAPKAGSTWRFSTPAGDAVVDGALVSKRPHERIGARWPRT